MTKNEKIRATLIAKGIAPAEKYRFKPGYDAREYSSSKSKGMRAYQTRRRLALLEEWKEGIFHPSGNVAKGLLILEHGEKCQKCGWAGINPFSNTIPVELEHIDGDCYNNKYENCQLLCPNCHAMTPTYKALNAGKGRGRKFYKVVSKWAKEQGIKGIFDSKPGL
jgi:hypothetical protein